MTTAPRDQAPPGLTVGGYTLLSRIGEGGMGVVHLARTPAGDRIALKVLRPHIVGDDEARARLAREVNSLSRIRSRWVAEIVDADPWGDIPFVATRYVPGLSLHDHVVEEGPITGAALTWFAGCLAEGLASVHRVGVLHRDIKPTNVLMEGRTPILIDFGLARVADDPKLTHTGWLLGTPGYLAPEILHGDDATAASDVHSWAATVAYAGLGRAPFGRGPSMAIMDRVRRGEHDLGGLPEELRGVVAAALDPDPARRPTLDQLLDRFRPGSGSGHVAPPPPVPSDDLFTVPLAIAAQAVADDDDHDDTDLIPFPDDEPATRHLWDDQAWPEPEPAPRVSFAERTRRALLLGGLALAAGAGVAAYPWPTVALLLVLTWLLRSGSLAASAHGDRRRLRGRKWYDGVLLLLGAPWDLVRSIPSTIVLALWSLGLAIAASLLCYAVAAGGTTSLFFSGLAFATSLWLGPGGSRVRSPISRTVHPASRTARSWAVGMLVVLAVAAVLGYRVDVAGTSWTPGD
ncbi:MAG TPA: serine/threonine-protein kinase, partial [Nocardioides sp.]|nr:serine/threonine-protein kinase [Nocardioides sp.]